MTTKSKTASGSGSVQAFTLIELLVIIVIIAVLTALLLPALSSAKSSALRIQCISNQKQLAVVWRMYADDHNENLALNGYFMPPMPNVDVLWVAGGNHYFYPAFYDTDYLLDPEFATFGTYFKSAKVYKCPADHSTILVGATCYPKIRSYSMNGYLGWDTASPPTLTANYLIFNKLSDLSQPGSANTFLFQDVMPENLCHPAFVVRMPGDSIDGFYHYPSTLHNWTGVLSFCDGHAEAHCWKDPRTRPPVNAAGIVKHTTSCPNNTDLAWIRERTTVHK